MVRILIVQKRIEKMILSNKFIPENSMCIDWMVLPVILKADLFVTLEL
jgi:hypothetical protein